MTEVQSPAVSGVFRFRGPALDLRPPDWSRIVPDPVYCPFAALVLCTTLANGEESEPGIGVLLSPPAVTFRAAAVANMAVKALSSGAEGYSFRWRIGSLFWLPKRC
jgi:hypothetical protein